nr:epidermal patterning factor-like protein 3 [Ipomoea batatas]
MIARFCCISFLLLTFALPNVETRSFAPINAAIQVLQKGQMERGEKIGSIPPSCEHKCYGCMPCEAIQVPTTSGTVGVQYTNYKPEGWKCKCGPALYTP